LATICQLQGELNKLLEMEDVKWRQRGKRSWFKDGDRNTQYFHAWANQRQRTNFIGSIRELDGHLWTRSEEVGTAFSNYFQHLFQSEGVEGIEECISVETSRVSPELNSRLTEAFTEEDINLALSQMHPLKSPGPDGFGVSFYQHHWGTIGDQVRGSILNFLNGSPFNPMINETFIVLIPKGAKAVAVSDYRPISLCNVFYKLIAKVLANRLKMVLPSIISQHQSAFVPGRLITDNVLLAYEALHAMNTRMRGRKGYMAVKVDGRISRVPIAAGGTRLSHLFFADDSLLFCRANFME